MRYFIVLFFLFSVQSHSNDVFWSKKGHRVVGEVAQKYLSRKAKRAISKLLDGKSLAEVSNFADAIKADAYYKKFSSWHYVNIPANTMYSETQPNASGDLVQGIYTCIRILKDAKTTREEKVFYLKFLVHLIGDLHQPLHVGRAEDKGGNTIQLQWFDEGTNLHSVWDTHMIEDYGMSYTELVLDLPLKSKKQIASMQRGALLDWISETQLLANKVYASVEQGEQLKYRYSYDWFPDVKNQLQKGGVRLAKVLNTIFK